MELAPIIQDLALILAVGAGVSFLFHMIRQPVVVGYLVAGLVIGPHSPAGLMVTDLPSIQAWAALGVIFLMFTLGLEFSFRRLTSLGLSAAVTAFFEMTILIGLGFFSARALGWSLRESLFLGAMISISSTTIIIKALDDLGLRARRFAGQILGILIFEDLFAVLLLVSLSSFAATGGLGGVELMLASSRLVLAVGSWFLLGYFLVPRFVRFIGRRGNDEMLTVLSLGLCLALVTLSARLHYSVALGAFIMGSILAESTESKRIEELVRPLRDVFSAVFFVTVGMLIDPRILLSEWPSILVITATLVFGKTLAITLGSLLTGQTLRTSVQVGFGMAQIGEFSFIVASLGQSTGMLGKRAYPVIVAVSMITTFLTPYLIRSSHRIAVALEGALPLWLKHLLSQYTSWAQAKQADAALRKRFYRFAIVWVSNAILVVIAFRAVSLFLVPVLETKIPLSQSLKAATAWATAMALSAPFIWAMFTAFRGLRLPFGGTLLLSRILAVFWVGIQSAHFFPAPIALLLSFVLLAILSALFYKQLETSYRWFEEKFLAVFEVEPKSRRRVDPFKHLAPWDAHLARVKVHPNAEIAGHELAELNLREDYGVNVVVIQRGTRAIVAPPPNERVFPKDELLLLGTDEQIERIKRDVERPPGLDKRFADLSSFELRSVELDEASPLIGQTLGEARMRERLGGIVVGIERGETRLLNPSPQFKLKSSDRLWIVGEPLRSPSTLV